MEKLDAGIISMSVVSESQITGIGGLRGKLSEPWINGLHYYTDYGVKI